MKAQRSFSRHSVHFPKERIFSSTSVTSVPLRKPSESDVRHSGGISQNFQPPEVWNSNARFDLKVSEYKNMAKVQYKWGFFLICVVFEL